MKGAAAWVWICEADWSAKMIGLGENWGKGSRTGKEFMRSGPERRSWMKIETQF